ncbi:MAG: translation initiation factor IF-3 [Candidatus Schekmanbacteria bacterium]|nr:translation initiation factor IF-3 [Candidatus Schekmanbacteria bacterium]
MRINDEIRASQVRVVSADSTHLGVKSLPEALSMAAATGLDLVEVSPEANPPVCKIMDYGKFKYQKSKRDHESKKHQKVIQVKEIKIRPSTGQHDYDFKLKHAKKFLQQGNKVKITITFRGRETAHVDLGKGTLLKIAEDIAPFGEVELQPKREGRRMLMILAPAAHRIAGNNQSAAVEQPAH